MRQHTRCLMLVKELDPWIPRLNRGMTTDFSTRCARSKNNKRGVSAVRKQVGQICMVYLKKLFQFDNLGWSIALSFEKVYTRLQWSTIKASTIPNAAICFSNELSGDVIDHY